MRSREPGQALAQVATEAINAGAAIRALVIGTIVDVHLALFAGEVDRAGAAENNIIQK